MSNMSNMNDLFGKLGGEMGGLGGEQGRMQLNISGIGKGGLDAGREQAEEKVREMLLREVDRFADEAASRLTFNGAFEAMVTPFGNFTLRDLAAFLTVRNKYEALFAEVMEAHAAGIAGMPSLLEQVVVNGNQVAREAGVPVHEVGKVMIERLSAGTVTDADAAYKALEGIEWRDTLIRHVRRSEAIVRVTAMSAIYMCVKMGGMFYRYQEHNETILLNHIAEMDGRMGSKMGSTGEEDKDSEDPSDSE